MGKERGQDTCRWLQFWVYTALSLFTHFWASVSAASEDISALYCCRSIVLTRSWSTRNVFPTLEGNLQVRSLGLLPALYCFRLFPESGSVLFKMQFFSFIIFPLAISLGIRHFFLLLAEVQCDSQVLPYSVWFYVISFGHMLSSYPLGLLLEPSIHTVVSNRIVWLCTSIPTY